VKIFFVLFSAEATANMFAAEETLTWLLDIIENDPDPFIRSAQHTFLLVTVVTSSYSSVHCNWLVIYF